LKPTGDQDRFQPTGFPEIGHVIYDAPRANGGAEKVCIVDSAASMANHLEKICWDDTTFDLVPELAGLPYVRVVTDVDVFGPLGTFGYSVMKGKADRMWDEFVTNLRRRIE